MGKLDIYHVTGNAPKTLYGLIDKSPSRNAT